MHECAKHKEGIHRPLVVLQLSVISITFQSLTFCLIFKLPEKQFHNPLSISQALVYGLLHSTVCPVMLALSNYKWCRQKQMYTNKFGLHLN